MNSSTLQKILFIDIETVPQAKDWNDLDERTQILRDKKTMHQRQELSAEKFYAHHAGILAEFGKIICISCGLVHQGEIRVKSFYGHHEEKILQDFCQLLHENYSKSDHLLCAHNGKEFDFPYIARRLIIHQIPIPKLLQIQGKKPWEITLLDTLDLWKFGDYKHYTSLDLLAHILGIESPKDDIDGSQVAQIYYEEKNLDRIKNYCEKDVITLINVFLRMNHLPIIHKM